MKSPIYLSNIVMITKKLSELRCLYLSARSFDIEERLGTETLAKLCRNTPFMDTASSVTKTALAFSFSQRTCEDAQPAAECWQKHDVSFELSYLINGEQGDGNQTNVSVTARVCSFTCSGTGGVPLYALSQKTKCGTLCWVIYNTQCKRNWLF